MIELACRTFGEADRPPVVLLHGLFGSAANWGTVARRLSDRFHVLVPDLRNHGQSPHAAGQDYVTLAEDVAALMDRHRLAAASLVGHSMGGKVAMVLALRQPQRVTRLAVVDMAPVAYGHDFENVLEAFRAVELDTIGSRADADLQMQAVLPDGGVRAFLLQNLVRVGDRWRANLDALASVQAQITGFPRFAPGTVYPGPAIFIYGGRSDYVRPAHRAAITGLFPAAGLCEVQGAGHWVFAERPQAFMDCLVPFLQPELSRRASP
jgi:esterase